MSRDEDPGTAWRGAVAAHVAMVEADRGKPRHRFRSERPAAERASAGSPPAVRRPGARLPESHYRDLLASQTGGTTEARLPFGRADVLTDTTIWEVEPVSTWRAGVKQALQYAAQVPQQGALALYGDHRKLPLIWRDLQELPEPLELWWLTGDLFVRIKDYKGA